ncbi:MAG: nucleotidyltransferase substrate binding protein [Bacteroidetes bacterium]|nr:nucleotidyltransferase substrate binding protein [Bacteroidota bacterium]
MEPADTLAARLTDFLSSLNTFERSLQLDMTKYNGVELHTIKNRQIQKFEYCIELCWKIIKVFLNTVHGVDAVSPKSTIKEFYRVDLVNEQEYELLNEMLDDRNRLSHIYNELFFEDIYLKLNDYLVVMKKVSERMR